MPYEQRCVKCDDNEQCDLQTAALYILREGELLPYTRSDFKGVELDPLNESVIQETGINDGYPDQSTLLLGGG